MTLILIITAEAIKAGNVLFIGLKILSETFMMLILILPMIKNQSGPYRVVLNSLVTNFRSE
ncbi:hypothetical protein A3765_26315 [Oleiphilus sp. HI0130]|nr:hypothetical protein A3744_17300 [Oleiphilus sp. HI0073]KZZ41792.1 hypothetical protein A3758_22215 [Oleiphilus sp. HI0118]KZZ74055.1 hypothetical protein A3765_26315 [Oleiphilus sp. HI0130]KZZ78529.1 hypothetical protein A3767_18165 [Oleiphilus sp. HI0133]